MVDVAASVGDGTLNDASGIFVPLLLIPVAVALNKMIRRQSLTFILMSLLVGMTGMLAIVQVLYIHRLIQTAQQGVLSSTALLFIGLWMILVNALGRAANPVLIFCHRPRAKSWISSSRSSRSSRFALY